MTAPVLTEIAPAKINLALHVRERMADGYHRIETLFAFAEEGDVLSASASDTLSLTIAGPFAHGLSAGADNLVMRAAAALQQAAGVSGGAALRLEKKLPVASGIGGGSADAAAALRLLSRRWETDLPLEPIAAELGADVPACLANRPVRGVGRGDELSPLDAAELSARPLLLINPGVAVPTGLVFQAWDGIDRGALAEGEPLLVALAGRNDLEQPAIRLAPVIGDLLSWLQLREGVVLARMSGSGATCFALFDTLEDRDRVGEQASLDWPGCWTLGTRLKA
ncbi:4-(cytidine 5'-diphospho)-2-C-methyl-D-erythritol kinase [Sphingomonas sp.]|jgi:4-diphosphocytidyl-2-C-methyl-D-erythritol kinase|uniref:4-(cytidine 5'-diphospho)-2-C-methyl-D-erythritol kinase n=1 Tax=Sphingomonas sp. TaxID=28214 RepID=UPI002DF083B8|nr:4-(cytidine 5'-diphospho)-2-C-methyl-D-erythritol kinase [Sphingomonas sp.]HEV2568082.1 4-(cytidine 5'-diphospho)-2-C-methyl-D-erythritol kinase [Sphingomonas sp.]